MDNRLLVMALPVLVAASWALFNIGRLAIQQLQRLTRQFSEFETRIKKSQLNLTFQKI